MIYSSDYSSGYPANLNIAYINGELSLQDVNYANVSELADAIAQESNADITLEQISHGTVYDTDMAFAYMSIIYPAYSLYTVQQYVPMGEGFYVFTYTVDDDQIPSDITSIMNSIKFKQ
ncbi:MAG: hypothetical protein ACC608_08525 [Anaerofustis sp.]